MVPRKETALTEVWFFSPYICSSFNTKEEAFLWIFLYSKVKAPRVKSTRGKWINTHDLTDIYCSWYHFPPKYHLKKKNENRYVRNFYMPISWSKNATGLKKHLCKENVKWPLFAVSKVGISKWFLVCLIPL